ncbi:MAG TPA: RagB/SusD family nutrient uptake outer membrane protein [Ohtaekwangia sp.]|uniref:RagB/SusD family nutrient uptake outer membrane protein n=1 Tax=Ohtaekwangia sp. TaxID=2066019 RepID=UPI002F93B1F3
MRTSNKFKILSGAIPLLFLLIYSCSDSFLDQPQKGALGNAQALSKKGAEQSLIGAYAGLKGLNGSWTGEYTNWVFGSIAGGDAHKGSDGGDQADINPIASFTATPTNAFFNDKWVACYDGVNRCNATLKIVNQLSEDELTATERTSIVAEARFLRGWYHFEAKRMWNMVPYVDESIDYTLNNYNVANNVDIWPMIEADFEAAYKDLAASGMSAGRANKWAAAAYLAKAYLYQGKYDDAKVLFDEIIASGVTPGGVKYGLNARFHDNFDPAYDNSKESVFAYQASINDGSGGNNANFFYILNWPYNNGPGGCCGFFQPSFDLVNSFRTDDNGLPLLDGSYNTGANQVKNDQGLGVDDAFTPDAGYLDPRIDWTAGRRGLPYLDWGNHPGASWIRLQSNGGPYSPKKHAYTKGDAGSVTDGSSWTKGLTSINFVFMRYADVLLMAAECEVKSASGSLNQAETYVNMVRARAANPAGTVKISDASATKSNWEAYEDTSVPSHDAANYNIAEYPVGTFAANGAAYALQAVHMERKLELAMEGHRFFDLVRWGETTSAGGNPVNLQAYLDYEGTKLGIYNGVKFTADKNEYYPIPQNQIDLEQIPGKGSALTQNKNY